MLLTRRYLKEYQESMMEYIPEDVKKELLDKLGYLVTDDEGHVPDFTEQDIIEQMRKTIAAAKKDRVPSNLFLP